MRVDCANWQVFHNNVCKSKENLQLLVYEQQQQQQRHHENCVGADDTCIRLKVHT